MAVFLRLHWPVLVAVSCFGLCYVVGEHNLGGSVQLPLLIGPIGVDYVVNSRDAAQFGLVAMGSFFFIFPIWRNYSPFFPKRYGMQVYFDDEGIYDTLNQFSKKEQERLAIDLNWPDKKAKYLRALSDDVQTTIGAGFRFDPTSGALHSHGETSFVVKKIRGGVQVYRIVEAEGTLVHNWVQGGRTMVLRSEFRLTETPANIIRARSELFIRGATAIAPIFRQTFWPSPTSGETIHHRLTVVSKIWIFPYIKVGRSLYLRQSGDQPAFPVGYAIYEPDW